jgi:hypothetical protein
MPTYLMDGREIRSLEVFLSQKLKSGRVKRVTMAYNECEGLGIRVGLQ